MKNSEINKLLESINTEHINKAMKHIDSKGIPSDRKSFLYEIPNKDTGKTYPPPLLIEEAFSIATGKQLPENFFNKIGKNSPHFRKLKELGITILKIKSKMYKYYLKKASRQDVSRTTVINNPALTDFFGKNLHERDDEAKVTVNYTGLNRTDPEVILVKKQDIRIFIDRSLFSEEDILFFSSLGNNVFNLEIIKKEENRYSSFSEVLENNFLLTNSLNFKNSEENMKQPLNQILFGPPGTGKTYQTITKALDIIGIAYNDYPHAQELFKKELGNRIEFVTMHQSFSYEDFVQGLKPDPKSDGNGLIFDYKNGVFKEICKRAKLSRLKEDNNTGGNHKIDFENVFEYAFEALIKYDEPVMIERDQSSFNIYKLNDRTMWFETSKGTKHERYTIAKKTLKEIFDVGENNIITSGNKGYFDAALSFLNKKSEELQEKLNTGTKTEDQGNFVIILDEINRANISKVFGELITLIEDDKREQITTTLPSGDPFTVPKNLYIIGTMNTADKSIAMVDIALRRRFEFIPLYPAPDLITDGNKKDFLKAVNSEIKEKKSIDFQIGHADFMKDLTLEDTVNRKTIPLLMEYFRNNTEEVKKIIIKCIPDTLETDNAWFEETGLIRVKKKNQ